MISALEKMSQTGNHQDTFIEMGKNARGKLMDTCPGNEITTHPHREKETASATQHLKALNQEDKGNDNFLETNSGRF